MVAPVLAAALPAVLPAGYGLILLEIVFIMLMYTGAGFPIGKARRKYFTKEFFEKNFPELKPHPAGGYPDTGSGRFADKLPMDQWIAFNNAQRAHLNFLEQLPIVVTFLLIAGIVYTKTAVACGAVYIIGRLLYIQGYNSKTGAPARLRGSMVFYPALITLLVTSVMSCLELSGGVNGIIAFAHSYIKA